MPSFRRLPVPSRLSLVAVAAIIASASTLAAADPVVNHDDDVRIVPQIMVGTSGFEPGVALEYRPAGIGWNIRPEVFLSEDVRVGAGLAALYDFGEVIDLGNQSSLEFGPRLVYHNADNDGWEGDAMAEYVYGLDNHPTTFKQSVGLLGALGLREHKENGDHKLEFGANVGVFYAFRF
jgi:hypothetical protein